MSSNIIRHQLDGYFISTDPSLLDPSAIHQFLTSSYWAAGIPLATVVRSLQGSLCFGVYQGDNQIGFARVVTDGATFAYLCDVYILDPHRGKGLSKELMKTVINHPSLQGLRRFSLATRDAHGLYRQFGFEVLQSPDRYMEILNREAYDR